MDLGKSVKATQTDASPAYKTISAKKMSFAEELDDEEDESANEEASGDSSEGEEGAGDIEQVLQHTIKLLGMICEI